MFFLNVVTGERTWTRPRGFSGVPAGERAPRVVRAKPKAGEDGDGDAEDEADADADAEDDAGESWLRFVDAKGRPFYFETRTQTKSWRRPACGKWVDVAATAAEKKKQPAFVSSAGMVFEAPDSDADSNSDAGNGGAKEEKPFVASSGMAYAAPSSSSSSESGSGSDSDSDDSGDADGKPAAAAMALDEPTPDALKRFHSMLEKHKVTHVARWDNWAPKLATDAAFVAIPAHVRRAHFEAYVRSLGTQQNKQGASSVKEAKRALERWWDALPATRRTAIGVNSAELLKSAAADANVGPALAKLGAAERTALASAHVRKQAASGGGRTTATATATSTKR